LVDLAPDHALNVPLYWHFWRHSGDTLKSLTSLLERHSDRIQKWTI
jgi:LysR family transcriptional regulator (chromosome initiation inhibitor)